LTNTTYPEGSVSVELVEKDSPEIIRVLQERGALVVGLTAKNISEASRTEEKLKGFGINFDHILGADVIKLNDEGAVYRNGIIYAPNSIFKGIIHTASSIVNGLYTWFKNESNGISDMISGVQKHMFHKGPAITSTVERLHQLGRRPRQVFMADNALYQLTAIKTWVNEHTYSIEALRAEPPSVKLLHFQTAVALSNNPNPVLENAM